jgi:ATP adenylyltransferase
MDYFFNFEKVAYLKGEKPEGCILCLLRDHDSSVENLTVWEDGQFNISLNLYPYNPGHLLIFPLRHIEDYRELTDEEDRRFSEVLKSAMDVIDEVYSPTAVNFGCNMGLDAGASIRHLHFHLIPRYPRETGIADLIAGKRVLVENPLVSAKKLRKAFAGYPLSNLNT